jgi:glycerol-3-phosphate dehydrogenase
MSIESAHDLCVISGGFNRCCVAYDAVGQGYSIVMSTAPCAANPEGCKFTTYRRYSERMRQKIGEAIGINGLPWIGHSRLLVAI